MLVHNVGRNYASTEEFEAALHDMDPGERVATVKSEAKAVADENGFVKNKNLST